MRRAVTCALLVLMLGLFGAGVSEAATFEEFKTSVAKLLNQKAKPDALIKLSNDALAKDVKGNAEYEGYAYALRGHGYWAKNDLKRAGADARKSIEVNPKTEMGRVVLVDVLTGEGKLEEASKVLDELAGMVDDKESKEDYRKGAAKLRQEASAVTPVTLWKAFDDNEVAAEDAYKGKVVTVKGTIESITTSATGTAQVNFRIDKHGLNKVVCEFGKDSKPQVAKLKKGQDVLISGTCRGMMMKSVFLKDSQLIE